MSLPNMEASPIESGLASQLKKAVTWDRLRVTDVVDVLVLSQIEKSAKESPSADCVGSGFSISVSACNVAFDSDSDPHSDSDSESDSNADFEARITSTPMTRRFFWRRICWMDNRL